MPIEINGQSYYKYDELPRGASLVPRGTAKALTGLEISECIAEHIRQMAEGKLGIQPEHAEQLRDGVLDRLRLDSRLNKEHLTYPKGSWKGWVGKLKDGRIGWFVKIWADSVKYFEQDFLVTEFRDEDAVETSVVFEQPRTDKPDEIRRRFGLPIFAKATFPDGTTRAVVLPATFEFGASGLPTASAMRAAQTQAQTVEIKAPSGADGITVHEAFVQELKPVAIPATELVAEPSIDYAPAEPTEPSPSIAKAPPKGVSLGGTKGRRK
jgi:hypothetical protein